MGLTLKIYQLDLTSCLWLFNVFECNRIFMTKTFRTNKHLSSALLALSQVRILMNGNNNSLKVFNTPFNLTMSDILVGSDCTPPCMTLWPCKTHTAHARPAASALSACMVFVLIWSLGLNRCIFLLSAELKSFFKC